MNPWMLPSLEARAANVQLAVRAVVVIHVITDGYESELSFQDTKAGGSTHHCYIGSKHLRMIPIPLAVVE